MRRLAALAATLALLVAGCGDDDPDDTTAGTAVSTTTRATATTDASGIDPLDGASTSPVSVPRPDVPTVLLTDVRAARHEGYDRVVFTFRGDRVPGYAVEYADGPVLQDATGDEVDVEGEHALLVRFDPASGVDLEQESAPKTYTGPNRLDPGTPEVTEVVGTGDFEAVLSWAVGLVDRVPFKVSTLQGPARVVIDVQNH